MDIHVGIHQQGVTGFAWFYGSNFIVLHVSGLEIDIKSWKPGRRLACILILTKATAALDLFILKNSVFSRTPGIHFMSSFNHVKLQASITTSHLETLSAAILFPIQSIGQYDLITLFIFGCAMFIFPHCNQQQRQLHANIWCQAFVLYHAKNKFCIIAILSKALGSMGLLSALEKG